MPHKVLVVDDEEAIVRLVEYNLRKGGFATATAGDGATAVAKVRSEQPDFVVLDMMLPDMEGLEVCREIRKHSELPILFLTARDADWDKIAALELGADDYMVKPFSPGELVARVRAILRRSEQARSNGATGKPLRCGLLVVDPGRREVTADGVSVELTPTEFELLACLAEHAGLALSREQLLDRVWGGNYFGDPRVVDVHIRHLREKLAAVPTVSGYLRTVRGVGYKLQEGT